MRGRTERKDLKDIYPQITQITQKKQNIFTAKAQWSQGRQNTIGF